MHSKPSASRTAILLGVAALAALSGCYSTRAIQPQSLASLDGYDANVAPEAEPERALVALDGQRVSFNREAELSLNLRDQRVVGHFESISVQNGTLTGRTTGGRTVVAPVATIGAAKVREFEPGMTAAAVVLGIVLTGLAGLGAYVALQEVLPGPVDGRALRIRGRPVVAPVSFEPMDWTGGAPLAPDLTGLGPNARETLASYWSEKARAEHASVPAFARLSLTLMAFGAPSRLVEAAHRAALQEIDHARLTFALANAYAGATIAPGSLEQLANAPAVTVASLQALAAESLVDGCFLEGVAADAAAAALAQARDPAVRAALTVIVPDERAHGELAWQVVDWCCGVGGPSLRSFVVRLSRSLPAVAAPRDLPAPLQARLAEHGWLPPSAWREIERSRRSDVAARAAALAAASDSAARDSAARDSASLGHLAS